MWCSNQKLSHCNYGSETAKGGENVFCPQCHSPMTVGKRPFPERPTGHGSGRSREDKEDHPSVEKIVKTSLKASDLIE